VKQLQSKRLLLILAAFVLLLAACSGNSASSATGTPVVEYKLLATLYMSPTPDEAQREATRLAVRAVTPTTVPTRTPLPTVYVGVFLGENAGVVDPIVDPARYQGTLSAGTLPTPLPISCLYPADPVFGTVWTTNAAARSALGCPGEPATPYIGTVQFFERGVMYWLPTGELWTVAPGGAAGGQFWYVPLAPPDQGWHSPAPEGLREPEFSFGALWRANDAIRQALGFARADESSVSITVQRFDGGALLFDMTSAQVFALVGRDDGIAYGPY
jgi:hypothetical protein